MHNKGSENGGFTSEYEELIGRKLIDDLNSELPMLRSVNVQRYVNEVGERLVAKNQLANNPYTFSFVVLDRKELNAIAFPGGRIAITKRILQFVESEDELAAVLAHEIAHVKHQHTTERYIAEQEAREKSITYGAGGAIAGGLAGAVISSAVCPSSMTNECQRQLSIQGAIGGFAAGKWLHKYRFFQNSQANEVEADASAYSLLSNAEYSLQGMRNFLMKLSESSAKSANDDEYDLMKTHPAIADRQKQLEQFCGKKSGQLDTCKKTVQKTERLLQVQEEILALKKLKE